MASKQVELLLLTLLSSSHGFTSFHPPLTPTVNKRRVKFNRIVPNPINHVIYSSTIESEIQYVNDTKTSPSVNSVIEPMLNDQVIAIPGIVESSSEQQALSILNDIKVEEYVLLPTQDTINPEVPTVKSISKFAIAALGVWLCSPILSLIDTSAVGLLSGTAQQAALNPAVSVTEYTALLIAFMYTGTTNLIASAHGENGRTADAFRGSLQLSTFVGTVLGIGMLLSGNTLLRLIIGKNDLDPVVFSAALKYVKIRALGMPAAAITGSAQAACLGMKDTKSPLLILVMAASINLLGDILLVRSGNAWIGGAAGAAWATVFSQYAALFMFIKWLTLKNPKESNTTKGLLAGKMSKRTLLQLPSRSICKTYIPYFLPVTTTSAGRVSAYVAMAHVISSAIGTSAMAAQQIILSFFFCLTPVADSLSLTAQSFVPAFIERINQMRGNAMENALALRRLSWNMMKSSFFFILGTLGVVAAMPFTSRFFTSDPIVLAQVKSITPFIATWFSFHSVVMSAEGILLGRKDLSFLGKAYGIYFFIIPMIYMKLKAASLAGVKTATLASVWQVFVLYGVSRLCIWNARLVQQTIKTMRNARKIEESVFA